MLMTAHPDLAERSVRPKVAPLANDADKIRTPGINGQFPKLRGYGPVSDAEKVRTPGLNGRTASAAVAAWPVTDAEKVKAAGLDGQPARAAVATWPMTDAEKVSTPGINHASANR